MFLSEGSLQILISLIIFSHFLSLIDFFIGTDWGCLPVRTLIDSLGVLSVFLHGPLTLCKQADRYYSCEAKGVMTYHLNPGTLARLLVLV